MTLPSEEHAIDCRVKVYANFDYHWAGVSGESLWATPVGKSRYRLENVPYYAYGLNYQDVVLAIPPGPEQKPEVTRVVKRSGFGTLRVLFEAHVVADRDAVLDEFESQGVLVERIDDWFFALGAARGVFKSIDTRVRELAARGVLGFESCQVRVRGEFGAARLPDSE